VLKICCPPRQDHVWIVIILLCIVLLYDVNFKYNVFYFNLPFRQNIDYSTFTNTKSQKVKNIPVQK